MALWGSWYNELGSMMQLNSGSTGTLFGTYYSSVGNAKSQYYLQGTYDAQPLPGSGGQAAGWAVAWNNAYLNAHSNTSWAGQYQVLPNGQEQIYTLWLLASSVTPNNDWQSTLVGQDTFTRSAPSAQAKASRRAAGHLSHPSAVEKG